jgi:hypothetical protein
MDALITFVKQPTVCVPIVTLTVLAALTQASSAQAQQPPAGTGVVAGTLRQAATGQPLVRGWVCLWPPRKALNQFRCVRADSSGGFQFERVPSGPRMLRVVCDTYRLFGGPFREHEFRVVVKEGGTVSRDLPVVTAGCDLRPLRRITGVFSGHYRFMSEFVPCPRDRWTIASDSVRTWKSRRGRAWVRGTKPGGGVAVGEAQPKRVFGENQYFVRWRGTIVGPHRYGHHDMWQFMITVDSVLDVRTPRPGDCG